MRVAGRSIVRESTPDAGRVTNYCGDEAVSATDMDFRGVFPGTLGAGEGIAILSRCANRGALTVFVVTRSKGTRT